MDARASQPVPPATPRLLLTRAMRLRTSRDFALARELGRRLTRGCLVANWRRRSPGTPSRLGVITSRKVGSAVSRNRARRLLRQAFRLHQHELRGPVDLVLVARSSIAGKTLAAVERDFLAALSEARLLTGVVLSPAPLARPATAPVKPPG